MKNKDLGASPDGDRAAGLRPQPPTASSQSSIPSAALLELAEHCEKAEGPDRALNALIHEATGREFVMEYWSEADTEPQRNLSYVPTYTASIDAALTLVPEGWDWLVRNDVNEPTAFANVSRPDANNVLGRWDEERQCFTGSGEGHNYADAATPALALCAAALKARAQESAQ